MSAIKLATPSSGSISLSPANTASNLTITVPAVTGTMAFSDGSSNFQMNSGYGSNATAYGCRAWVNFNGTGTVAIRASGNVSSITDNGVGNYTVNLTNAMPDTNYSVCAGGCFDGAGSFSLQTAGVLTAPGANGGSFTISTFNTNNSNKHDATFIFAGLFR